MKEWIATDQILSAILAPNHCGGELAGTENWNERLKNSPELVV